MLLALCISVCKCISIRHISQDIQTKYNASTSSTDESESLMSTERDAKTETDSWIPLIEEERERSNAGFDEMKESHLNGCLDAQSADDQA